jgi:hypothetical protein
MKNFLLIIPFALLIGSTAVLADQIFSPSNAIDVINRTNPRSPQDDADTVRFSVSSGVMTWRDKSWTVQGNQHTPRGRFRISDPKPGSDFMIPESSFFLAFKALPIAQTPRSHPQYRQAMASGAVATVWGIHKNNLQPGQIGAGCLLAADDADLFEMSHLLPGATIVITN